MSDLHSALAAMFANLDALAAAEKDDAVDWHAQFDVADAFWAGLAEVRKEALAFWGDAAFASQPDPDQQPALLEVRAG